MATEVSAIMLPWRQATRPLLVVVLLVTAPGVAAADPSRDSPPIGLLVSGSCPDEPALAAALGRLVPGRRLIAAASAGTHSIAVTVEDLGESYRVTVAGRPRDLPDSPRD